MSISFACPNCEAQYSVGENLAGKKSKCRQCGGPIVVPMPVATFGDDPSEDGLGDLESLAGGTAISSPPPRKTFVPREAIPETFAVSGPPPAAPTIALGKAYVKPEVFNRVALVCFVIVLGLGAYFDFTSLVSTVAAKFGPSAPKPYLLVGVVFLVALVACVVVLTPLLIGSWRMAGRITKTRPPEPLFLNALGLAAAAFALVRGLTLIVPEEQKIMAGAMGLLLATGMCFAAMLFVHRQQIPAAGTMTGFMFLALMIAGLVISTAEAPLRDRLVSAYRDQLVASQKKADAQLAAAPAGSNGGNKVVQAPDFQAETDRLTNAFSSVDQALKRPDSTKQTLTPLMTELTASAADLKSKSPQSPLLNGLDDKMASYQKALDTLPSSTPPDDLNTAPLPVADWSAPVLAGSPVTLYGYDIVLPKAALCDFMSSDADGYKWNSGGASLLITRTPAAVATQQRPWLVGHDVASPASNPPYRIDARNGSAVSAGTIGGVTFTRVAAVEGNSDVVVYAARVGSDWLTCTLSGASGSEENRLLDYALKTLHPHPADAPGVPPIQMSDLLDRWQGSDSPQLAHRIVSQPNAEQTLLTAAGGATPGPQFQRMLPLLSQVATTSSLPLLWKAYDTHVQPDQIRPLLVKLDPEHAGGVSLALRDLKSQPPQNIQASLATIAAAPADPKRAGDIGLALADALDEPTVIATAGQDDSLEQALVKWSSADASRKLAKYLDDENSPPDMRHVAMRVLSQTHDKRYAFPITRWLAKDTRPARDALITLGIAAEPDVMKVLTMNNTDAKMAAAEALAKIGDRRAIYALQVAAQSDQNQDFRDQAKAAIEEIKQRLDTAKPPTSKP